MQIHEQHQEDSNSIAHSPYYGCTIQVVSKANISYEGILDGISAEKDRIVLKNVRVKGNLNDSLNRNNSFNPLNTVMIDHLTNDMHIYDQVCLNVRDILELKLLRLPSTFHESKVKLHSIDPCLVDIRLSCDESLGSNDDDELILSSSNESSSSINFRSDELSITSNVISSKPVTLLAKKVLPKKIERNHFRTAITDNRETNILRKFSLDNNPRKQSPIRVTITSKLNPNAIPFYTQQRPVPVTQNSSFTFYEQNRFQPHFQSSVGSNRAQLIPNAINAPVHQQQNQNRPHQRFIPPRQMAIKKNFNIQTPRTANYRPFSPSFSDQQPYSQHEHKILRREQMPGLMRRPSSSSLTVMNPMVSTQPLQERLSAPINNQPRRSPVTLHSSSSLPYQYGSSGDRTQLQSTLSFKEPIGSRRGQRTISGTSSGSSLSVDIGPHSIVQFDSTSNALTTTDGQYDFEKANEEFRRYLELEELVTRRTSSACSTGSHPDDNNSNQQQSQSHSYKKELSFFDRISCTATTGTAVGYTEMDEDEKNRETFGDDALLIHTEVNDDDW